jgi:hypothetical protein
MDKFKELLESELLGDEARQTIQSAWEAKLEEARKAEREIVERELREEFANLYQKDKDDLVAAMNSMVSDVATKYAKMQIAETRKLKEERESLTRTIKEQRAFYRKQIQEHKTHLKTYVIEKLRENIQDLSVDHNEMRRQRAVLAVQIREAKTVYERKLNEHKAKVQRFVFERFHQELRGVAVDHKKLNEQRLAVIQESREMKVQHKLKIREDQSRLKDFVLGKLSEELKVVENQKIELAEAKISLAKQLKEHRIQLVNESAETVQKLKAFVIEHLHREIGGLELDRKSLFEHKVRLFAEGRKQIEEQRRAFVQRASTVLESKIRENMRVSMTKLKEDIQYARENMFGRKIFEAYMAEYMSSYMYEGTHMKRIADQLNETRQEMEVFRNEAATLKQKLMEQQKVVDGACCTYTNNY